MNIVYSNGQITYGTPQRLKTLTSRIHILSDFSKKKIQENMDFDTLKAVSKMGTQRILDEIYESLKICGETSFFSSIQKDLDKINHSLSFLENVNQKDFLLGYGEVHKEILQILTKLEDEKKQTPPLQENQEKIKILDVLIPRVKKLSKTISKVILIGCTSLSLSCSHIDEKQEKFPQLSGSNKVESIQNTTLEQVDNVILKMSTHLEEFEQYRGLFSLIKNNPESLRLIPKFNEKIQEISYQLEYNDIFSTRNYIKGETWKKWNQEIVNILFPTTKNISQIEQQIIITAFQKIFSLGNSEGKFGPKSKQKFLQIPNDKKNLSFENTFLKIETNNSIGNIRQVSVEEFEKYLFSLEGRKYKKGTTDCSGIFFLTFNKLDILKDYELTFEREGSTTIIKKLTHNQKEIDNIMRGDLVYWESSRYPGSKHIAYISKVEDDGVWLFDSSIDTGMIKSRFMSWEALERKKGLIAGTPIFLAQI